jgi:hypothetical protein
MEADAFTDLALRLVAGEATDAERRALEAELAAHPVRRQEFEQLTRLHALASAALPMTEAVKATQPVVPTYRMNELRTAVRQHFGPATKRPKATAGGFFPLLRWILAGGGATVLAAIVIFFDMSDRAIEIGLYQSDLVRGDNATLVPHDVPAARIITFEQDTPFDQWQSEPLDWTEHAKIWVDNEHDLLHIVARDAHGHSVEQTEPLAPTDREQSAQIKQAVEALGR